MASKDMAANQYNLNRIYEQTMNYTPCENKWVFCLSSKRIFIWYETVQNSRHFIKRFKSAYEVIDRLPLHSKNKIIIVSRCVLQQT